MKVDRVRLQAFFKENELGAGRSDSVIAGLMPCKRSTVAYYRKRWNVPVADGFVRRLKEHFGPEAEVMFHEMVRDGESLSEIGRVLGRSRQRAHQIFVKLYRCTYTEYKQRMRESVAREKKNLRRAS